MSSQTSHSSWWPAPPKSWQVDQQKKDRMCSTIMIVWKVIIAVWI
jgi:hypothetical protein